MTDVLVTGNLIVNGTSEMKQKLTVRTDSFFTGFLRVGALAAVGYNVLAIADITQNLGVGGDTTMTGALTVNGTGGIVSQGPVIISDILRTNPPYGITCGGQLAVANAVTLQQDLSVGGNVTVSGLAAYFTSLTANNALTVSGKANVADTTIAGNLNVTSTSALTATITTSGTLTASSDIIIAGKLTASGTEGIQSEGPVIISDILRTNPPFGIVCGGDFALANTATFQKDVGVSHLIGAGPVPTIVGGAGPSLKQIVETYSRDTCGRITIENTDSGGSVSMGVGYTITVKFGTVYPTPNPYTNVDTTVVATWGPGSVSPGNAVFQVTSTPANFVITLLQESSLIPAGGFVSINWVCIGNVS